jgi:ribonuclease P/MRP protein subunit POP5
MKLKILPPTLRDPKRYISFESISQMPLGREEIISLIWETSLNFFGEYGTSMFDIWIMNILNCKISDNKHIIRGIIQCNREEVSSVRVILSVITKFRGGRVVFHTLGISGTIKSAIKKFIKLNE